MKLKHFNLSAGSQIFKAFSDETRIRILQLLYQKKEMCISDLEIILDFTQSKISRHLNHLKNSGLVSSRKIDQWSFYAIKDEVSEFVELVFKYLGRDADLTNDLKNYETLFSKKELAISKLDPRKMKK